MPDIVPTNPSSDKIGTTSKPFGEMNADAVKVGGTNVALSNRALDAFGSPSDSTDLDATESLHGLMPKAMVAKLNGIESAATADQSDSEIETAYNNQVSQVSAGEISAATSTDIRRFSPADVKSLIDGHTSGGYTDEASQDAVGGILTDTHTVDLTYDDAGDEITADLRKKSTSMISGSQGQLSSDIGGAFVVLGSTGTTAAAGNDSRFPSTDESAALTGSDSPSLANPFQTLSGAKTIALDEFTGSLTDNTTGDATTSRHGLLPKADKVKLDSVSSFGTAAPLNAGTAANNLVQLDGTGSLPAVDGSALTGITAYDLIEISSSSSGNLTGGTWNTRDINEASDTGGHLVVASDQMQFTPGTYEVEVECKAYQVEATFLRLRNVTDGSTVLVGLPQVADAAGDDVTVTLNGRFTALDSKQYEIQHWAQTTATNGATGVYAGIGSHGETVNYLKGIFKKVN